MTTADIRAELRQGAQECAERRLLRWWTIDVLPTDGAFDAALKHVAVPKYSETPEHAAIFLDLCAEAL
jgi:hypothetical protein